MNKSNKNCYYCYYRLHQQYSTLELGPPAQYPQEFLSYCTIVHFRIYCSATAEVGLVGGCVAVLTLGNLSSPPVTQGLRYY